MISYIKLVSENMREDALTSGNVRFVCASNNQVKKCSKLISRHICGVK